VSHANRVEALVNKKIIAVVVLLIVAFAAGYLPQYAKAKLLERELGEARQKDSLAQLRDQITGELARGDPGVLNDLQALWVKTRQATAELGTRQPG
jgi:hypothetical protein